MINKLELSCLILRIVFTPITIGTSSLSRYHKENMNIKSTNLALIKDYSN